MWQIWLNWQCNKLSDCGIAVTFYDWQQVGPPHLQFRDPCCRCLVLAILWAAGSKLQWHDLQATTGRVTMDKEKSLSQVKATAFEKPSKYCTRMSNECNVWFFRLDSENVITCTHTHTMQALRLLAASQRGWWSFRCWFVIHLKPSASLKARAFVRWPKEPQHSGFCATDQRLRSRQWFHLTTRNWLRNRTSCSDVCLDSMHAEELQRGGGSRCIQGSFDLTFVRPNNRLKPI